MRDHWCGRLRLEDADREVNLAGWVHRRRDHGGVIFLDLRDSSGLVQVVVRSDAPAATRQAAERLRPEFVATVAGTVHPRPEGTRNLDLPTGEIEIHAEVLSIVAEAETPPLQIEDRLEAAEELRLRYRYLDLRRPEMQRVLRLRHRVGSIIRRFLDDEGFLEVETPVLTKATPEGARDFLVPSRLQPGAFFALPQSPQLFKQLLMIGGIDRYYQLARCFRDEDPRADRQPDFTQLDLEMSFIDEEAVQDLTERMFQQIFREVLGVELPLPFPRITYDESLSTYGNDRPDLRFGLPIKDVTAAFSGTGIRAFKPALDGGGVVKAIAVAGSAGISRKLIDGLTAEARNMGAGGLAWLAFSEGEISSPLAGAFSEAEIASLRSDLEVSDGDLVLLVCDEAATAEKSLGAVRLALADLLDLRPPLPPEDAEAWKFVWVVDPPLVEWNADEGRWDAVHHPFTAPRPEHEGLIETDPAAVRARCYDVVLNGWELGTGSIRIHSPALQRRVFSLIGLDEETVERRFGWFVKAFRYGAPPHGGIAPGFDRIVAMLAGKDNIREVIAFPKSGAYTDPMTGAPDRVDPKQLAELRLKSEVEDDGQESV